MKRILILLLIGSVALPASADAAKNHMTRTEASRWVKAAVVKSTSPYFPSGLDTSFRCPTKVTKRRLRCKIKLTGYFGESVQTLRGSAAVKLLPHRPSQGPNEYTLRVWGSFGQPGYKSRFDYVGGVKRYYGRYLQRPRTS